MSQSSMNNSLSSVNIVIRLGIVPSSELQGETGVVEGESVSFLASTLVRDWVGKVSLVKFGRGDFGVALQRYRLVAFKGPHSLIAISFGE